MSTYRRDRVPGGSYFVTVNLCDRNSRLLVTEIDKLRHAVSTAPSTSMRGSYSPTTCTASGHSPQTTPAHMDYIHFNPVTHGLTTHPADWPFSPFRRCAALGLYPATWAPPDCDLPDTGERP
jgi:hypothetical protein